jgi:predicted Zn-dependent protease
LFEFNAKHYPNSANVYDGLADAYERNGQVDKALHQMALALRYCDKNDDNYDRFKSHQKKLQELVESKKAK